MGSSPTSGSAGQSHLDPLADDAGQVILVEAGLQPFPLDAGATESGRPYFVMELVKGVAITDYCDQCNLTTRDRLELFVAVCQAIQHAHQKGIIHRDVKPSNVMMAMLDGEATPKVIDLGVAMSVRPAKTCPRSRGHGTRTRQRNVQVKIMTQIYASHHERQAILVVQENATVLRRPAEWAVIL